MLAEVKKCAESHDIKGLRYIFVDSLDVDPTFEKYKEDYEYCKGIEGFFDPYVELRTVVRNEADWNMDYWGGLKLDLMKNFSKKRFEHMIQVARVIYADKIARLVNERKLKQEPDTRKIQESVPKVMPSAPAATSTTRMSEAKIQEQQIRDKQRALEMENERVLAEQRAQRKRIEAARDQERMKRSRNVESCNSKKFAGIVLAIAAVVILVLIVVVLK